MKKDLEASYTVEAAFILPLVFALLYGILFLGFYLHDQIALEQIAWESAFYGAGQVEKVSEAEIDGYLRERLSGHLFVSRVQGVDITLEDKEVTVELSGEAAILRFAKSLLGYRQRTGIQARRMVEYPCAADYVRKGLFLEEKLGGLWGSVSGQ